MEYKIYTRGGDKGQTSLLGGKRVPKYHIRIEAYGTVDELTSYLGLVRDLLINEHYKNILLLVQNNLFTAEAHLAADNAEHTENLPKISEKDISILEEEIDKMNEPLPGLNSFILPGGHPTVSNCHIARTICRRAERLTIKLAENHPVDDMIIKLLNRLSDYLFVLARKTAFDLNIPDIPCKPHK
ncbi:MAG: cob(I)yrinic acid a,c-diamide adenosyltransferase [Bacteroidales bacterium]|nr:cob(I)yrinic acid a,c-diamide adenosyltransferase [Bacteroidales bacterium]